MAEDELKVQEAIKQSKNPMKLSFQII